MRRIVLIPGVAVIVIGNPGLLVLGAAWWREESRVLIGVPFLAFAFTTEAADA